MQCAVMVLLLPQMVPKEPPQEQQNAGNPSSGFARDGGCRLQLIMYVTCEHMVLHAFVPFLFHNSQWLLLNFPVRPVRLAAFVIVRRTVAALVQCGQAMNQCMRNHNWSDVCSCRGGYTSCVKALGCSDGFVRTLVVACEISGCPSAQVRCISSVNRCVSCPCLVGCSVNRAPCLQTRLDCRYTPATAATPQP
jgi:hypothetical protein